jgi:hypothetical protein
MIMTRKLNRGENKTAGASKIAKVEDDLSDDPFINVTTSNAMPTTPSTPKKVYLEDFHNFTVE